MPSQGSVELPAALFSARQGQRSHSELDKLLVTRLQPRETFTRGLSGIHCSLEVLGDLGFNTSVFIDHGPERNF